MKLHFAEDYAIPAVRIPVPEGMDPILTRYQSAETRRRIEELFAEPNSITGSGEEPRMRFYRHMADAFLPYQTQNREEQEPNLAAYKRPYDLRTLLTLLRGDLADPRLMSPSTSPSLKRMLLSDSQLRRVLLSIAMDEAIEKEIGDVIFITRSNLEKVDLTFLTPEGGAQEIMYEHMPTWEAMGTAIGGLSEAKIVIAPGAPESKALHAHPGFRIVTCLTDTGKLALPQGTLHLRKGAMVWMPKLTKHSFQDGIYLAIHGNEPGFDHKEAIIELDNEQPEIKNLH